MTILDRLEEAFPQLLLQKLKDASNLLQRNPLASEFCDQADFDHFLELVQSAVTALHGTDDALFIPPLQLT